MPTPAFDTLTLARRLREQAGFTREQAEAMAEALAETRAAVASGASKPDLRQPKRLSIPLEAFRTDLRHWLFGAFAVNTAVGVGAMFGLAKLLGH